jgi:hypothetical protein
MLSGVAQAWLTIDRAKPIGVVDVLLRNRATDAAPND